MTDSTPTIPASTFILLHSPAATQILSSWPVYRNQGATIIAAYLSCHNLQDLLDIIEALYQPIWRLHAQIIPNKGLPAFAEVAQYLELHADELGTEKKMPSNLDISTDYLGAVWASASKDSKIAARFEVKGSMESVRSLHKMWSLQSWIRGHKEWFSDYKLSARQKNIRIRAWLNNDEEELEKAEEKVALSGIKEKQPQTPTKKLPAFSKKPLKSIPIFWANDNAAAEETQAWYSNTKLKQDSIANRTWESFRDEIRRSFPLQDRSQNINKIYLQQHVSFASSTNATETELLSDLWTDQRASLSTQDPSTTALVFTSKEISTTDLRDAFWETWSEVIDIWAPAINEDRELELSDIEDAKERQKRMQPREGKAELEARLEKYRARHPGSRIGLEGGGGGARGKRMWDRAVDEVADEEVTESKRRRV